MAQIHGRSGSLLIGTKDVTPYTNKIDFKQELLVATVKFLCAHRSRLPSRRWRNPSSPRLRNQRSTTGLTARCGHGSLQMGERAGLRRMWFCELVAAEGRRRCQPFVHCGFMSSFRASGRW